jgi:hypothetical protein
MGNLLVSIKRLRRRVYPTITLPASDGKIAVPVQPVITLTRCDNPDHAVTGNDNLPLAEAAETVSSTAMSGMPYMRRMLVSMLEGRLQHPVFCNGCGHRGQDSKHDAVIMRVILYQSEWDPVQASYAAYTKCNDIEIWKAPSPDGSNPTHVCRTCRAEHDDI